MRKQEERLDCVYVRNQENVASNTKKEGAGYGRKLCVCVWGGIP